MSCRITGGDDHAFGQRVVPGNVDYKDIGGFEIF